MIKLKNLLLITFLFSFLNGCAQSTNTTNSLALKSFTNRDSLYQQIQEFPHDEQQNYEVYIDTRNSYDILVNDLLIASDYGSIKQNISYFANKAILRSGKQQLQIRFYPEYTDEGFLETLTNNDYLTIRIRKHTSNSGGWKNEEINILEYNLPKVDDQGREIDYSQKKELVLSFEFQADVPYELDGWMNGVEFNPKDHEILKQQLSDVYHQRINDLENNRRKKIKEESGLRDFEQTHFYYLEKNKFREDDEIVNKDDEEYFPLNDCEIYFYGENRVITLRKVDDKNKGDGALMLKSTDVNGAQWLSSLDLFFYQPKGSDKLVLIR